MNKYESNVVTVTFRDGFLTARMRNRKMELRKYGDDNSGYVWAVITSVVDDGDGSPRSRYRQSGNRYTTNGLFMLHRLLKAFCYIVFEDESDVKGGREYEHQR